MTLKEYYYQTFPSDLALLVRGFEPQQHAGILAVGHIWTHGGCTQLSQVPADHRPRFLACLYFTVLVDQAMHTHTSILRRADSRSLRDIQSFVLGLAMLPT